MSNNDLIKKIQNLCEHKNIDIATLLNTAGLSSHLIDDWSLDKCAPSLPALLRICEVLNIDLAYLFKSKDATFTPSQLRLLGEWKQLSVQEKDAIFLYIQALKEID